ncbi:hypothetical protein LTR43_011387 [Exophiala xenobiotica]|nr:hypothetical protein LTR55_012059 [Exophiala xenobiotica]
MAAEQTITSQTSELATLRRRLHERDQAAEQKLHRYRHRLSATNQTLVQAQRAAESTTGELLCTKATKEQVEKEFKEACQQMREQATTYSSTEEELAEARRSIAEQKGKVSSLQKQLSESQAHARELLSTSRAELKQVKLTLDTATQQLQCNEAKRADSEVEHSVSCQHKCRNEKQTVQSVRWSKYLPSRHQKWLPHSLERHLENMAGINPSNDDNVRMRSTMFNRLLTTTLVHLRRATTVFTVISQRISGVCKALSIQKIT